MHYALSKIIDCDFDLFCKHKFVAAVAEGGERRFILFLLNQQPRRERRGMLFS